MYKFIFLISLIILLISSCDCRKLKSTKYGIRIGIYDNNENIYWKEFNVTSCSDPIYNVTGYRVINPNDYKYFIYYKNENIDNSTCLEYDGKYHYFGKYPDENGKNGEKFKINICKRKSCG